MKRPLLAMAAALSVLASPETARAQSYPIDCAILLCLAGGWPASVPCTRARAEFIRRITPWPVEPPLQIWRCPMNTSLKIPEREDSAFKLFAIAGSRGNVPMQSAFPASSLSDRRLMVRTRQQPGPAVLRQPESDPVRRDPILQLAQAVISGTADIDISGRAFDFVRSIKVWHVAYYRHRLNNRDSTCQEMHRIQLGSYGTQGNYRWTRAAPSMVPVWMGMSRACSPSSFYRAVGVEWTDHLGKHGHEVVRY